MSAERVPTTAEAEIIYLIPPNAGSPRVEPRWTVAERFAAARLRLQNGLMAGFLRRTGVSLAALGFAIVGAAVAIYGLYLMKSSEGIDLVPGQSLEDILPVPGSSTLGGYRES